MLPLHILVILDWLVQALHLLRRGMRVGVKLTCGCWAVTVKLSIRRQK